MKHLFLSLLIAVGLTACESRNIRQVVKDIAEAPVDTTGMLSKTIHTNSFSVVDIDCFADVTYHQTKANEAAMVRLAADNDVLENTTVSVTNSVLNISINRRYRMPEKTVLVVHIYAPFINSARLNGVKCMRLRNIILSNPLMVESFGVGAVTADSIVAPEVTVKVQGTGSADLRNIRTGLLRAEVVGDGQARMAGFCEQAEARAEEGASIDLSGLKSKTPVKAIRKSRKVTGAQQ